MKLTENVIEIADCESDDWFIYKSVCIVDTYFLNHCLGKGLSNMEGF